MITVRINEKITPSAGPALEISARWSRPAWLLPVLMNRLLTTDPYITGSSFPYTSPMSRAVKIIGSHSYHLTTRLSSTLCGFERVVHKQWWFQDFPYRWATIPTVGPGLPDGSQEGEPGEQLPTLWSHHCSQKEKYEEK